MLVSSFCLYSECVGMGWVNGTQVSLHICRYIVGLELFVGQQVCVGMEMWKDRFSGTVGFEPTGPRQTQPDQKIIRRSLDTPPDCHYHSVEYTQSVKYST